jgi:sulfite reductase (ferredoxin)
VRRRRPQRRRLPGPAADSRQKVLLDLAQRLAVRFRPRTRSYYEVWIDGEQAVSAEPAADEEQPLYGSAYLPRKFKIGLAWPGDNCVDIYSHDLGLVPVPGPDGAEGFAVLVGGGLGASHARPDDTFPRLADPLGWVPADRVEDLAEAVILAFRDLGNREDRKRARLKYVLEELGVDAFRREVEARFGAPLAPSPELAEWHQHDHLGWHRQDDGRWFLGVPVPSGRVAGPLRAALTEVVERFGLDLRVTARQDVLLTGIEPADRKDVRPRVSRSRRRAGGRRHARPAPGHGLPRPPHVWAGAGRGRAGRSRGHLVLEGELARRGLPELDLHVRMTGCPNGCARPYTAEIGIVGRTKTGYDLHLGGAPAGDRLARPVARGVKLADLPAALAPWLDAFAAERRDGESFGTSSTGSETSREPGDRSGGRAGLGAGGHTPSTPPSTDDGLRQVAAELDGAPAAEIVRWATVTFGPAAGHRRLHDGRRAHRHRLSGGPRDRGHLPRHPVPLPGDPGHGRAHPRPLPDPPPRGLARRPARRPLAHRPGCLLPRPQGRAHGTGAAGTGGLAERPPARRLPGPRPHARRAA